LAAKVLAYGVGLLNVLNLGLGFYLKNLGAIVPIFFIDTIYSWTTALLFINSKNQEKSPRLV